VYPTEDTSLRLSRLVFLFALFFALLAGVSSAQQANQTPPGSGTVIRNQAFITFLTSGAPSPVTFGSNVVIAPLDVVATPFAISKQTTSPFPLTTPEISYRITVKRNASGTAHPLPISVDGALVSLFLIEDAIPAGTTFFRLDQASGASHILYHLRGTAADQYTATLPADVATIDRIAAGYGDFPADTTRSVDLTLLLAGEGSKQIVNTGVIRYVDDTFTPARLPSSTVTSPVVFQAPTILYYNSAYETPVTTAVLGSPLHVEVSWAEGNHDPNTIERGVITLTSSKTGDKESYEVVETGPNTGIFRVVGPVPTRSGLQHDAEAGNGIMETLEGDTIIATIDGVHEVEAQIVIESSPGGIVFDSKTNAPIAGVKVTLVNSSTRMPAAVYDFDGKQISASMVTGADGRYYFPVVPPGSYIIVIETAPGYQFASTVKPGDLPPGRIIDANGSYGYPFQSGGVGWTTWFDIPGDPVKGAAGIFVDKAASRMTVELGESLDYVVRVKNVSGHDLRDVVVSDRLPFGFRYRKGSARLEGKKIAEPKVRDADLEFSIGALEKDATLTLTYRVQVTVGATDGDGINRAEAWDNRERDIRSNRAEVRVEVIPGVFTDRGVIFGKIYVDANRNKMQDAGEHGVPGIRLYMEDGSYAITDSEGKYSFYGIQPKLHVVKVDNTTLPPGAELLILSNRHAGDPGSRFVDLTKGEMHKADFAIAGDDPAVLENVAARRRASENALQEIESNLSVTLQRETGSALNRDYAGNLGATTGNTLSSPISGGATSRLNQDVRSLPASGVIGVGAVPYLGNSGATGAAGGLGLTNAPADAAVPRHETAYQTPWSGSIVRPGTGADFTGVPRPNGFQRNDTLPLTQPFEQLKRQTATRDTKMESAVPAVPLEEVIRPADASLAFLDLKDGDTLPMAQTTVRVQGPAAGVLALSVNGKEVGKSRIGKQITHDAGGAQALEYIAVPLNAGSNQLALTLRDPFGNVRGETSIHVIAPGNLGRVILDLPQPEARADGKTLVPVKVRLVDPDGIPVTARTPITLETSIGEWAAKDLNPKEPATQVFLEGGEGEFFLKPPLEPSDAIIRVSSGVLKAESQVSFLPELRPMIAVGLLEGRVDFSRLNTSFGRRDSRDSFQDSLKELSLSTGANDPEVAGRTAFFMKGQLWGEYVLTAAYDSEKDRKERLFRDIQPDEFYPIYGDSSLKGFDAQSTSSLYVKVENKKSFLLYGDYTTGSNSELRQLGNYNRSLTGGQLHFEKSWINANLWASYDSTRQVIQEIPANGTSGPFAFKTSNALINSEKVEILTRSRDQPSLIIKTVAMSRFTDYQYEPFSGRILFKAPIPSVDENLNPISIRITFEDDQGGDKFWVYGGDAQVRVTDWLEVGGSVVDERNPFAPYRLYSGNAALKLTKSTFLLGEVAFSDAPFEEGVGRAERLELRHQADRLTARLYWSRADEAFRNAGSTVTAGRMEAGAQIGYQFNQKTSAQLEAISTESTAGGYRRGVLVQVGYALSERVRIEVGGRYSTEQGDAYATSTSLRQEQKGIVAQELNQQDIASIRAKLSVPLPMLPTGSLYGEYENDLVDIERRVAAVGLEYQANAETKLYLKHEFISSLDGAFDLNASSQKNTTVVGVQSTYMKDGQLFNEYRMRDAIDGRQAEGAIGLRNSFEVAAGLRVQTTFERISPLVIGRKIKNEREPDGRTTTTREIRSSESTAVTAAFDYVENEDWKLTGRGEFRTSDTEDAWLFTLGYAHKINEDLSGLARAIYDEIMGKGPDSGQRRQIRLQMGVAYRPVRMNFWNMLAKYELKLESDTTIIDYGSDRVVHILATDVNWQPRSNLTFSLHYAGKLAFEEGNGLDETVFTSLISARALVDITDKWDAGLTARVMFDNAGRIQFGVGPELGYNLRKNMRVAAGYNVFGFHDRDLSVDNYTQQGAYFAFNMKFDEDLFKFGRK